MTARQLKITGEIVLVLSFLTQTLLFDYYNDKSKALSDGFIAQSLVDKGAELRELKFFVAKSPLDSSTQAEYQKVNIQNAAFKLATAKIIQYTQLDTPKQVVIDKSNALIQASYKVHDFNSYMDFINYLNIQDITGKSVIDQIHRINSRKALFRWIFWSCYLIGSLLLILATIREKKRT